MFSITKTFSKNNNNNDNQYIPLKMNGMTFTPSKETSKLLKDVGGKESIIKAVDRFYEKMFLNKHLDQFIRSHNDPHVIAQKVNCYDYND
eukprot:Pgem_evm1s2831